MTYDIRRLTGEELQQADELDRIAFGSGARPLKTVHEERPGRSTWGVFDRRLVAKATDRAQGQWFGGSVIPTCGVAGLAVAPEYRGRGIAGQLLASLLASACSRGAIASALYPTGTALYRSAGYELVGALTTVAVPAASLARLRVPANVDVRPATDDDTAALSEVYDDIARHTPGLLDRNPPLFPAEDVLGPYDGVTVVERGGEVDGFARWSRGPGYGPEARLAVRDLLARSAAGTQALLASLGSWSAVVGVVTVQVCDPDPVRMALPTDDLRIERAQPWMLRLLDAPAAVAARSWPASLSGRVDLDLTDEVLPHNVGPHRLVLDAGTASLEPGGDGLVRLSAGGLAALYAGGMTTSVLRRTGGLSGGTPQTDALLDAAFAGPRPNILDYF